ncbi:hypothetical protein HFN63_35440 [Rhizobium leguminosarum]|uniref:phosphopantetheine-binding protein n=1 Tax=Rhizobium leguminosarum TaxID=384 RepID=UPI001C96E836|nr:phosphopantetheine-binding protein [Rhizobium leguminosarum]MBY5775258.1 hypothetical protein [Rhizobium leguminosarum]
MSDDLTDLRTMLANYVDIPVETFDMSEDLDLTYDMDSTELTEFAKNLTCKYGLAIQKSDRADWRTGNDIVAFIRRFTSNTTCATGDQQ